MEHDLNDSEVPDGSITTFEEENKQVTSHVKAVGVTYRNDSPKSPFQSSNPHSRSPSPDRRGFISSFEGIGGTKPTQQQPKKKFKRKPPSPPLFKSDIKLKPELMINIDPPISILNYMKKSNLLPNIKYDSTVIQTLLKDHDVAKAVNFNLGENHLITKSLNDMKESSFKQFQSLNQYKYGITPQGKRDLLQKTIVDDKLKTLLKFDPNSVTPPLTANIMNNTNNNAMMLERAASPFQLGVRHNSGFFLDQASTGDNPHLMFNPDASSNTSQVRGKFTAPTMNATSTGGLNGLDGGYEVSPPSTAGAPFRHPLLRANMKPISFIPADPTNPDKISDGILHRQTSSATGSKPGTATSIHPTTTPKMMGMSVDPDKKKIEIKERAPRSANPKKEPLTHDQLQPGLPSARSSAFSPLGSTRDLSNTGLDGSKSPTQRASSPFKLVTDEPFTFGDAPLKTPMYTPATFRRPKPREDLDPANNLRGESPNSIGMTYSPDPLVYQTEKLLDQMMIVDTPIDRSKSISWDEEGHPKHMILNTSTIISDDLSSAASVNTSHTGNLSAISKIPKTPTTPGGKNRKKYGEFVEHLVRSSPTYRDKKVLEETKKLQQEQDYQAFHRHQAEVEHDAFLQKEKHFSRGNRSRAANTANGISGDKGNNIITNEITGTIISPSKININSPPENSDKTTNDKPHNRNNNNHHTHNKTNHPHTSPEKSPNQYKDLLIDTRPSTVALSVSTSSPQLNSLNKSRSHSRPVTPQEKKKDEKDNKNKFHCVHCLSRVAQLWCSQCLQAYCQICWNQVSHHANLAAVPVTSLENMEYPLKPSNSTGGLKKTSSNNTKHNQQIATNTQKPFTSASSPSRKSRNKSVHYQDNDDEELHLIPVVPSPKSYAKSILFATYQSEEELDQVFHRLDDIIDPRIGTQNKPATVPRDETAVLEYQDYPNPPIYLDGKGQVHSFRSNNSHRPPSSANSSLSPPSSPFQGLNHHNKVIVRTLSPPVHYENAKLLPNNQSAKRVYDPNFQKTLTPNIRYLSANEYSHEIQQLTQSSAHNNNTKINNNNIDEKFQRLLSKSNSQHFDKEITIRRDPYKFRKRPKVAFSIGAGGGSGGGMSIAFSAKPSNVAVPMKGITKELVPVDWKEGLYSTKEVAQRSKDHHLPNVEKKGGGKRGKSDETPSSPFKEVKPREMNIFNGVAVYTVNYQK